MTIQTTEGRKRNAKVISSNSPYHTALTHPLRSGGILLLLLFHIIWRLLRNSTEQASRHRYFKGIRFDRTHFLLDEADKQVKQLDHYALQWIFKKDNFSDVDMAKFLEGLPGYINSCFTEKKLLTEDLTTDYILTRIREHFMTCTTPFEHSEEACINRVVACVNSLRLIFKTSGECPLDSGNDRSHGEYIRGIIHGLNTLCEEDDTMVALRASCVRSLAFQGLLSQLTQSTAKHPTERSPAILFPCMSFSAPGTTWSVDRSLKAASLALVLPTSYPVTGARRCGSLFYTTDHWSI